MALTRMLNNVLKNTRAFVRGERPILRPETTAATRMPVPVSVNQLRLKISGRLGRGLRHHGRHALYKVVQAVDGESGSGCMVKDACELRRSPHKDNHAQRKPWQPGFEDRARAVRVPSSLVGGDVFSKGVENAFGFPDTEKCDQHDDGGYGSADINQPWSMHCGYQPLRKREGCAGNEDGGPDFKLSANENPETPR